MISRASTESGFRANVAFSTTLPSITFTSESGSPGIAGEMRMGSTEETPSTFKSAADTESTSPCGITTSVGCPEPPGKCSPNRSRPTTESGRWVNASAVDNPRALSVVENPARIESATAVKIHSLRGRFSTAEPILAHVPVS